MKKEELNKHLNTAYNYCNKLDGQINSRINAKLELSNGENIFYRLSSKDIPDMLGFTSGMLEIGYNYSKCNTPYSNLKAALKYRDIIIESILDNTVKEEDIFKPNFKQNLYSFWDNVNMNIRDNNLVVLTSGNKYDGYIIKDIYDENNDVKAIGILYLKKDIDNRGNEKYFAKKTAIYKPDLRDEIYNKCFKNQEILYIKHIESPKLKKFYLKEDEEIRKDILVRDLNDIYYLGKQK